MTSGARTSVVERQRRKALHALGIAEVVVCGAVHLGDAHLCRAGRLGLTSVLAKDELQRRNGVEDNRARRPPLNPLLAVRLTMRRASSIQAGAMALQWPHQGA